METIRVKDQQIEEITKQLMEEDDMFADKQRQKEM